MKHFRLNISYVFALLFLITGQFSLGQKTKTPQNASPNQEVTLKSAALGKIEARQIGPAMMSGRITAIDGANNDPRVLYVGTAGGGVWKTTTGGARFTPVFDKYCQSIGALTIDQQNTDVVWVGTGESNMRNTTSVGVGLYKSTDAGENWVKMGLDNTEHIAKIALHPQNSNTVFVAVPGHLWNAHPDRGLYRSTDGGKTWDKALYIDENTGCADVLINPQNPNIMYAAMWQFRRKPYSFESGGKGSGLYKSTDGGKTWHKITAGLPEGDLGRIALALAPSSPANMFAIIEAEKTGLYISDNGGDTWKPQSATSNVTARPFYFSTLVVDPTDAKRVYRPALSVSISTDGGYSFTESGYWGGAHPDHHALWINPQNPSHMYLGSDGGVYVSMDKGNNWLHLKNLPVSQTYHVSTDQNTPYNVYIGMQDNGTWRAPSRKIGGIQNGDWQELYGGDGFWVQPDLENPDIVYAESQGGNMSRINTKTNEGIDIQPYPEVGQKNKLRWNWNTPIVASPTNKKVFYTGAQYLYKTQNGGITWQRLSDDLTTNDPAKQKQDSSGGLSAENTSAENHCTIFTIAESPLEANQVWVGTDDGNLQLSTDGGKSWNNLSKNYSKAGIPAGTWVSSIFPSRFDKNTVYVTFDNHAYGDTKTYAAQSKDLGKTWTLFKSPDFKSFAHKIIEDTKNPKLLFLGTEMGLFMSINGGTDWVLMKGNIPHYCMVRDMLIEPATQDLVIATHGRGVLIVDNIAPLRQITPALLNADFAFLPTPPVPLTRGQYGWAWAEAGHYAGNNPSEEAQIMYYLKNRVSKGNISIEIYDPQGKFLYDMPGTKRKGINIVGWDMSMKPPKPVKGGSKLGNDYGPLLLPGKYKVVLKMGDKSYESAIDLIENPQSVHSISDRNMHREAAAVAYASTERLAFLTWQIVDMQDKIKGLLPDIKDESLKNNLQAYSDSLNNVRKSIIATKEGVNAWLFGEEKLRENLSQVYGAIIWNEGRPTDSHLERLKGLDIEIDEAIKRTDGINKQFLSSINALLQTKQLPALALLTKEEFDNSKE